MVVREFDPDDAKEVVACAEYIAQQYWLRSKRTPPEPEAGVDATVPPRCDPVPWSPVRNSAIQLHALNMRWMPLI